MGKRRYDAQRIQSNELRRLKQARRLPWVTGPYYEDELSAMLDIPMGDPVSIEARKIVMERATRRTLRERRSR
ncbi:hypothetical protein GCM10023063_15560 [Arthrobacter methylotrophus]